MHLNQNLLLLNACPRTLQNVCAILPYALRDDLLRMLTFFDLPPTPRDR